MTLLRFLQCMGIVLLLSSASSTPKNTGHLLRKLRRLMKDYNYMTEPIQAYIILSGDYHQNEFIANGDKRIDFISGFTGSQGIAVTTEHDAALWTDGRYFIQAEKELDQNWMLMKQGLGLPDSVSIESWLNKLIPSGGRVGVDPFLISYGDWSMLSELLEEYEFDLVPIYTNLIDVIWEDRPLPPANPIKVLPMKYTGKSWQEKVKDVLEMMTAKNVTMCIITALDDIAWLLNLRGSDIDYNPVFFSYVIITKTTVYLLVDKSKLSNSVLNYLGDDEGIDVSIHVRPYAGFKDFISRLVAETSGNVWISRSSSYGIHNLIPENRKHVEPSPVVAMKMIKNTVELEGMLRAHVKDSISLCEYFAWLETEVPKGDVTEITGAEKLFEFKKEQDDFVSLSFPTVSGVGPNAASAHYTPNNESDRPITTHEVYLCDSGGQYLDGTTDVTRTVHFGTPSQYERECFTSVLKGHIALASLIFPELLSGLLLDPSARIPLWEQGLDYLHGTGHGIGAFLNVHEGPVGIPSYSEFQEGMVVSIEPGYYEDGKFGIRLENIAMVKKTKTKYQPPDAVFLTFQMVSFFPIQIKMIEQSMLTVKEIDWLNTYHRQCRDLIGKELEKQGRSRAREWLFKETEPLTGMGAQ